MKYSIKFNMSLKETTAASELAHKWYNHYKPTAENAAEITAVYEACDLAIMTKVEEDRLLDWLEGGKQKGTAFQQSVKKALIKLAYSKVVSERK